MRYPLTGDRDTDARPSAIVNRVWRGDAGGALLVANGLRGEQTLYDDAMETALGGTALAGGVVLGAGAEVCGQQIDAALKSKGLDLADSRSVSLPKIEAAGRYVYSAAADQGAELAPADGARGSPGNGLIGPRYWHP